MIEIFAKHKVAANLTMVVMILAGIWAVNTIPAQLDPPQPPTSIVIEVAWPGASAEDVAGRVTKPIENQLRNIAGLRELNSRSINGYTRLVVWFHYDTDMVIALDGVKCINLGPLSKKAVSYSSPSTTKWEPFPTL